MTLLLLSASQVSLKRECTRKYALRYIAKIESPSTPSQEIGKEVDDEQLQPYLTKGREFDDRVSGEIAASGLAHLPKPGTEGLEVQKHFILPSPSGLFKWQGYLDLWLPFRGAPGFEKVDYDRRGALIPIVGDFKTTKSFDWAKDEDDLAVDVQAQLYATWAMWERKAREVDLLWLYLRTQGARKAQATCLRVSGEHVYEQFLAIDKTGQEIAALRSSAPEEGTETAKEFALSLEPNPEACSNFGGCQYRHICNLSPCDYIDSIDTPKRSLPVVSNATIDLFANLTAKRQDVMGMSDRAVPPPPEDVIPAPFAGINPPEKVLPPAPPVGVVTAPAEEKKSRGRPRKLKPEEEAAVAKTGAELVAEMEANACGGVVKGDDFDAAWAALGDAVKRVVAAIERLP